MDIKLFSILQETLSTLSMLLTSAQQDARLETAF